MLDPLIEKQIYDHLFSLASGSDDTEGVVCAALVDKDGNILASSSSFTDGRHAEYCVIEKMKKQNLVIKPDYTLYLTLEPCSIRTNYAFEDCASLLIASGIKRVVYSVTDSAFSKDSKARLLSAGISYVQIKDQDIVQESRDLFNSTNTNPYRV